MRPKRYHPFDHDDPFQRFEVRESTSYEKSVEPEEYCIYLKDKYTGELVRLCDSDLPF